MNHPDHPQGSLPMRPTEIVPAPMGYVPDEMMAHDVPSGGKRITAKLIGRAVRRHWWQAGLLWIVGSSCLMAIAYTKVKPTYVAFSRVKVDPGHRLLGGTAGDSNFDVYKETLVKQMTSPPVLADALQAKPELINYPKLRQAEDPAAEIASLLNVGIVPKTNYIEVSMVSESVAEAVAIVNAVVDAFHKSANDNNNEETEKRHQLLVKLEQEKLADVMKKRDAIAEQLKTIGQADIDKMRERNSLSIEQYSNLSSQLIQVEIDIHRAEARLTQLQNEQSTPVAADEPRQITEQDVTDAFYNDPKVVQVKDDYVRASDQFNTLAKKIRDPLDPALTKPRQVMKGKEKELNALWKQLRPKIAAQLNAGGLAGNANAVDTGLRAAETELVSLKAWQTKLKETLETLEVKAKEQGKGALKLEFDRMDLARHDKVYDTIQTTLTQMEIDKKDVDARIKIAFAAQPSNRPSTSNRLKIMAMAPVGMMLGVLGLLVLLELHAGRVVDPEDLPMRIRVPVIGVVPPLPQVRAQGAVLSQRDEFRTQRQLDQFVQSLDHLRVALCSGRNAWGRDRRVILITSACASEGKTTLAAQLAERCVNAGLHTLLIDGDLRNPTLSRMLDVPTGRGLINVLRGEVLADEAMTVVGGAGGFHFMPSGTPKVDPSRLLHGDRLGKLLTQARESFDIVIVDAPPVLPVPDALTIGRWTDGAILAVRYDLSRFPLVEKANRRLASVGVPVIGAVVNGVKVAEATYGSYYPSYAYSNERAADTPLDV
jgi:succinoglycan biosynthesis transport protein ExoP